MTRSQCKSLFVFATRNCKLKYLGGSLQVTPDAIDAPIWIDEDSSQSAQKWVTSQSSIPYDGCISLQELLQNSIAELYFSTNLHTQVSAEVAEAFVTVCACCEFHHLLQSTPPEEDSCVIQGAIGRATFTTFLETVGIADAGTMLGSFGLDNWDPVVNAADNMQVVLSADGKEECSEAIYSVFSRRKLAPDVDHSLKLLDESVTSNERQGQGQRELYHSTDCPPIEGSCHPASTTLELVGSVRKRIDELKVGDMIRTQSGFEPVTALMHSEHGKRAEFFRFHTANTTMAITQGHYLFVGGIEREPASVMVGETLTTRCCGEQPIERIERTIEEGMFHLTTDSTTYYADGVLSSTYVAFVPLNVWKAAGGIYPRLRYMLGVPITPEGHTGSVLSIFWMLRLYEATHTPVFLRGLLWPVTMASTLFAELVNTAIIQLPATTTALALMAAGSLRLLQRKS